MIHLQWPIFLPLCQPGTILPSGDSHIITACHKEKEKKYIYFCLGGGVRYYSTIFSGKLYTIGQQYTLDIR